ncbi:MAG: cobalamin B12-binding domain-containing protein [Deltaproteobacteria bacterium]|nr:cobalamin B12-binding domain-containing protein [Deltaproteobacteria bacterium]
MSDTNAATHNLSRRGRVLVGKVGLDGHDRGAKVVARALRDAGLEVIYTGLHQTPDMIVHAAIQEDVDIVGLSILSGAHNTLVPKVIEGLRARGAGDVAVFVGGIIPDGDLPGLKAAGVAAVFTPGASLDAIVVQVRNWLAERGIALVDSQ